MGSKLWFCRSPVALDTTSSSSEGADHNAHSSSSSSPSLTAALRNFDIGDNSVNFHQSQSTGHLNSFLFSLTHLFSKVFVNYVCVMNLPPIWFWYDLPIDLLKSIIFFPGGSFCRYQHQHVGRRPVPSHHNFFVLQFLWQLLIFWKIVLLVHHFWLACFITFCYS